MLSDKHVCSIRHGACSSASSSFSLLEAAEITFSGGAGTLSGDQMLKLLNYDYAAYTQIQRPPLRRVSEPVLNVRNVQNHGQGLGLYKNYSSIPIP